MASVPEGFLHEVDAEDEDERANDHNRYPMILNQY